MPTSLPRAGRAWLPLAMVLVFDCAPRGSAGPATRPPPVECGVASARPCALPTVTFTLPHFRPGDLDRRCGPAIARATAAGFTGVTLVPSIEFLAGRVQRIVPGTTLRPGEIERCLALAFEAGLDIVYMPHLEAAETLRGIGDQAWRGRFSLVPGPEYRAEAFEGLLAWARSSAERLRGSETQLFVVVAAELERSTTAYPERWSTFVADLRREFAAMGLAGRVRLGFNPNWNPRRDPGPIRCASFRAFVRELDFIAPSLYGNWSEAWRGPGQAEEVKDDVLERLAHRSLCDVEEFRETPLAVGEFGLGGDLTSAARNVPPARGELAAYERTRAAIYRNLFDWIWTREGRGRLEYVNLWTLGVFDPILEGTPEVVPDPGIRALLLEHAARRRQGFQQAEDDPPRPASVPVAPTIAGPRPRPPAQGLD